MAHYYHEVNPDDRCATFYSKYALTVLQHMLPSEHIKLSEQYYLLGRIHESYGRTREALQDYRKAKEILDFRIGEAELELVSYAELCISISKLSLQSKSTL